MTETKYAQKLEELDRQLNDPEVPWTRVGYGHFWPTCAEH